MHVFQTCLAQLCSQGCSCTSLLRFIKATVQVLLRKKLSSEKHTQNRFPGKLLNHYLGNWAIWNIIYKRPGIVFKWIEIHTWFLLAHVLPSILLTTAEVWWGGQHWRDSMRNRLSRSAVYCLCVLCPTVWGPVLGRVWVCVSNWNRLVDLLTLVKSYETKIFDSYWLQQQTLTWGAVCVASKTLPRFDVNQCVGIFRARHWQTLHEKTAGTPFEIWS